MPFNYCIAIGQFENPIKQFHKLIVSYANSILPEKKIHLLIQTEIETRWKKWQRDEVLSFVHFQVIRKSF
jgi:N-acetylgalactosamine-N,N'-diacetylbacillosaminyl-diphospho-undecaprenol 4-alpha-N-acetylgalactosaminyltransferase